MNRKSPANFIPMVGKRFGKLIVVSRNKTHTAKDEQAFWNCKCDCKGRTIVSGGHLRSGHTTSCGCESSQHRLRTMSITHGMKGSPEYYVWSGMRDRCSNPRFSKYPYYGGRGIKVCERWATSFENFYADMGPRPTPKHTLDRADNNGNYTPENCQWVTRKDQARNRRSNRFLTFRGESRCISEWADVFGVDYGWLYRKSVLRGLSLESLFPERRAS